MKVEFNADPLVSESKSTMLIYGTKANIIYVIDNMRFVICRNIDREQTKMTEIMIDFVAHGKAGYEPKTTQLVKDLVKEGDVCVDVGASIGYFSVLFGKLVGEKGKVYAIEPVKQQHPYFLDNISINGLQNIVNLYSCAAWDKEEIKEMFSAALLKETNTKVQCVPLDLITGDLPKVDFIKIDVDGSEIQVLKGMEKTIEKNPNLKMIIEYYPKYLQDAGNNPQELLDILNKNFTLEKVGDLDENYWNYLCIKK